MKQGLVSPEFFKVVRRQFSWENISRVHLFPFLVGTKSLYGNYNNNLRGEKKVWKTVQMNFSCLCYLKIRRRLHIIRAVSFSCITKCFAGCQSAMTSSGTFVAGRAEMQRAEVKCLAHTPSLLQDLGTELFCFSHPQRAKLLFFSLDYYFLFQIKENKKWERKKNWWLTAVSLLKRSCPCHRNMFPRARIQNLLQNKTETFKNNQAKTTVLFLILFFLTCICECRSKLQPGSRVGLETWEKLSSCEILRQILQTHPAYIGWTSFKISMHFLKLWCSWTSWDSFSGQVNITAPTPPPKGAFFLWCCFWKCAVSPKCNDLKSGTKRTT